MKKHSLINLMRLGRRIKIKKLNSSRVLEMNLFLILQSKILTKKGKILIKKNSRKSKLMGLIDMILNAIKYLYLKIAIKIK